MHVFREIGKEKGELNVSRSVYGTFLLFSKKCPGKKCQLVLFIVFLYVQLFFNLNDIEMHTCTHSWWL